MTTENQMEMTTLTGNDAMMATMLNVQTFEQMQRVAKLFSSSGLVPKSFENNPAACFVGLQLATQLGINPFMLFQKIYNVGGKIGIEAQVAIAIANQRGIFEGPIEHVFEGKGTTRSCTAVAVIAKSKKTVTLKIDWETVEKEGWNKKGGSKWLTMPDQMFRYRSSLWLIRTYAPETLMGLSSIDELQDERIIDVTPVKVSIDAANSALDAAANAASTEPEIVSVDDGAPGENIIDEINKLKIAAGFNSDKMTKVFDTMLNTLLGRNVDGIMFEDMPAADLEEIKKMLSTIIERKAKK
ncbi:MAG: hypothetical protein EOM80_16210 [Erysipelotrichia bacterium]|nr:hypothetical protein [Erysipelotrichia bacterium]